MSRGRLAVGAVLLAALAVLAGGPAASASESALPTSEGSIPVEVTMYTTAKDGLVAKLNDVFGIGGKGSGIDFNDTTTAGPLSRVFAWTPDFLAGKTTDVPVERLNEWVTTISIDDKVVGFATIWINDATVEPELATFTRGVALGAALLTVPADATLIRDDLGGAWFTFTGADLTPLDSGNSGVHAVTPLASYQKVLAADRPTDLTPAGPNQGLVFGGITLGAVVLLVVVALVLLSRRQAASARTADAAAQVEPAPSAAADVPIPPEAAGELAQPAAVVAPTVKPARTKPALTKAKTPTAEPATTAAAAAKSPTSATASPRPAAAKKPAAKKPAAKKPTTAKKPAAAAAKPPVRKPVATKPDVTPERPSA